MCVCVCVCVCPSVSPAYRVPILVYVLSKLIPRVVLQSQHSPGLHERLVAYAVDLLSSQH